MTPDQVRALVEEVLAGRLDGWQLVLIAIVGSLLAAGIGAYFGAYLGEKGKSRAIREDLQDIVRRTEEIKGQISDAAALRREQRQRQIHVMEEVNVLLSRFFTGEVGHADYRPTDEFHERWLAAKGVVKVLFSREVYALLERADHFIGPDMGGRPSHELVEVRDLLMAAMEREIA